MKKSFALLVSIILICCYMNAYAADVSAFEAHSTIDLTPFKDEFYSATFDNMSYEATISTPTLKIETSYTSDSGKTYTESFTLRPRIKMSTLLGAEVFVPEIGFYSGDYTSLGGFRIVIGENRYLLTANVTDASQYGCSGTIAFGASLLKEIVTTDLPVKFCVAGKTSYVHEFTSEELETIKHYVNDLETVGILKSFSDDDVIIVTNYN